MTLFLLTLLTADARSWWGAYDLDGDGVRDRDDSCVRIPETINGYLDEDGCPDTLSGLTVAASLGTMILDGANLVVDIEGERTTGKGELTVLELVPGTPITIAAMWGCHAAQSSFTVEPRYHKIRLKLEPTLTSPATVLVRDQFGETPATATLEFLSSDPPGCSPTEVVTLERGYGRLSLGRGTHKVRVRTPDGSKLDTEITVGDEEVELFVDLPPPGGQSADGGRLLGETVYFGDDEDVLDADALAVVAQVARYLNERPELNRVIVEGHTDKRAWGPYNEGLSERRSQAVTEALIAAGVAADRLVIVGRGEKMPAVEGSSAEAMAKNRRVQFIVGKR